MSCLARLRRSDSAERRVLREVMERKKNKGERKEPSLPSPPPGNFPDISLRGSNNLNFWNRLCSVLLGSWSTCREANLKGSLTHRKNAFSVDNNNKKQDCYVMLRFIFCQRRVRKKVTKNVHCWNNLKVPTYTWSQLYSYTILKILNLQLRTSLWIYYLVNSTHLFLCLFEIFTFFLKVRSGCLSLMYYRKIS